MASTARAIYLYVNRGIEAFSRQGGGLYVYANRGIQVNPVAQRVLYLTTNRLAALPGRRFGPAIQIN